MGNKMRNVYRYRDDLLNEALDHLVVSFHRQRRKGKNIFVFTGCQPAVGTTSLAINLASTLARASWRTLLIDTDFRKDKKYKRLNETLRFGLVDYLEDKIDLNQIIYESTSINLDYIPSGAYTKNATSLLCSKAFQALLQYLGEEYDYIILDSPSIATCVDAEILSMISDATVLVAMHDETLVPYIEEANKKVKKAKGEVLGIVLNKVNYEEYIKIRRYSEYYKELPYKVVSQVASKKTEKKTIGGKK